MLNWIVFIPDKTWQTSHQFPYFEISKLRNGQFNLYYLPEPFEITRLNTRASKEELMELAEQYYNLMDM